MSANLDIRNNQYRREIVETTLHKAQASTATERQGRDRIVEVGFAAIAHTEEHELTVDLVRTITSTTTMSSNPVAYVPTMNRMTASQLMLIQ